MSFPAAVGLLVSVSRGAVVSERQAGPEKDPRPASNIRMAERLAELAAKVDPMKALFLAGGQVAVLERRLADEPALGGEAGFCAQYAKALLNAGRNLEGLAFFDRVERLNAERGRTAVGEEIINLRLEQALCHLREGERLNCLSNHNADSCLMPLQGGGIYKLGGHSYRAIGVLTNLLAEFPDNLAARWLLNVASMTVGEYPGGLPPQWLIPPKVFASDAPFPRFREIAGSVGLAPNELSGGSVLEDFDGDELLDVMFTSNGLRDPMHYFRNNGDGTFQDRTREAGLMGLVGGLNMVTADFDNDGRVDVLVLRGAWMREEGRLPRSLLRNRGDGVFEDVTEAAGLGSMHPSQTAVWLDFDGDGFLDLYVGNEMLITASIYHCAEKTESSETK